MGEDRRLSWVTIGVLLAALGISFWLASARLAFLQFFYLPVLLVAYWSGRRTATLLAVLCVLVVGFFAALFPEQFALGEARVPGESPWLHLLVWGCFLVLAGYAAGTLIERTRRNGKADARPAQPQMQLYNIGTLAIIKGYLRHEQVLKILQIQQKNQKLFGEVAIGLRLLTADQVDELLRIQREKRSVTSSEIAMAKLELAKARKTPVVGPRS